MNHSQDQLMQDETLPAIAFLGLSSLGSTIAARLANVGYPMVVFDKNGRTARLWVQRHGGIAATTAAEAASEAQIVITCALDEEEVRGLLVMKDGALAVMRPGAILIDHSALSERGAAGLKVVADATGTKYLDAALVGGPPEAEQGKLTLFVGGDEVTYEQMLPLFGHYAGSAVLVGLPSAGQRARLIYQGVAQHLIHGMSELAIRSEEFKLSRNAVLEGAAHALQQQLPEIVRLIDYEERVLAQQ